MALVPVPTNPGVYLDDSPSSAAGYFIDADNIRFLRGKAQTRGGYENIVSSTLTGKCRGLNTWADNTGVKWIGAGTNTNLYAVNDATVYDITPVIERGTFTNPFSTTITSTSVNVNDVAHGRAVGDGVNFSNASAVGGLTIDGSYTVTTVVDVDNYTITASSAATGTAGPGGGTVYYKYFLAVGYADGIGGLGFGTGTYSSGTYSVPGTGIFYLRTWSIENFGPNGIFSPRGGKIYEWAPVTAATELVTNGTFTGSATGWTLGGGWAYGANAITATASSAAATQAITVPANSWSLAQIDMAAWSTGSILVQFNSVTVIPAMVANGRYFGTFFSTGATANVSISATNATATIDNISITKLLTAEAITNAPSQNTVVIVTPEKFVMTGGTIDASTSNFDPLLIRWSDRGVETTWTPASTNLAGSYKLAEGSRIVGMKKTNNEILAWTDKALYAGVFTRTASVVYEFRLVGIGCGLIGPNAAAVLNGIAYWMAPTGEFFRYAGGAPEAMQSTMRASVFDNIAPSQQDKIWAAAIAGFQDVCWYYPDNRDGTNENSRYALCDTQEPAPIPGGAPNNLGTWAPGTSTITAWCDAGVIPAFPISCTSAGVLRYEEKGATANGANLPWMLQTASLVMGDGATQFKANSLIPDFAVITGGCTLTAACAIWSQSTETTHGPFMITAATDKVDMQSDSPLGREIRLLFQGNASPAQARNGTLMLDIENTGMTF